MQVPREVLRGYTNNDIVKVSTPAVLFKKIWREEVRGVEGNVKAELSRVG
jgi:hypothetical protein